MAKVGLVTIISIVLNLFLTFWLVNQYLSDVYFQSYVNAAIGQYYPFIVLTLGVGGGSGIGYLFLKRKHGDTGLVGKIQKSKSFKPSGPLTTTATSVQAPRPVLPTGAPPTATSKHTVYAVPPLPKSSTPSSPRSTPSSTWASVGSTKSSLESIISRQETDPRSSPPSVAPPRTELPRPTPSFSSVTEPQPPQPLRSIGETPSRTSPSWNPPSPSPIERRQESGPIFQKPGMDTGAKQDQPFSGFGSKTPSSEDSPVPSKWAPPEEKPSVGQWPEGGVKSIPPLPTKWTPPTGQVSPQDRPPAQQGFPRTASSPNQVPPRAPFPTPQGGPRPFVIQGPGGQARPGEQRPIGPPRPVAAPQPFRPDLNRPPLGAGPQPRPTTAPRPAAPIGGPMPQPWTPPGQATERKEPSGFPFGGPQPSPTSGSENSPTRQAAEPKPASESGGGGEMDWDTALDTILKTLRKDRVADTK